jgi:hypothetical protein
VPAALLKLSFKERRQGVTREEYEAPQGDSSRTGWFLTVVILYATACALPAISIAPRNVPLGIWCLIAVPAVCFFPAWWANVALIAGAVLFLFGRRPGAMTLGIIALFLSATFPFTDGPSLSELRAGYFVWLGSMAVFVLGTGLATFPQHASEAKRMDRPLAQTGA